MLAARYWAEAEESFYSKSRHRRMRVRRLGWSNVSQAEADALAEQRAQRALADRQAGAKAVAWRDPTHGAYAASGGIPIREEIVAEYPWGVLTRNCYGAICLNTEQATFLDVDGACLIPSGCLAYLGGLFAGCVAAHFACLLWAPEVPRILYGLALFIGGILGLFTSAVWIRLAKRVAARKGRCGAVHCDSVSNASSMTGVARIRRGALLFTRRLLVCACCCCTKLCLPKRRPYASFRSG